MIVVADTNVLLRAFLSDEASQTDAAVAALEQADAFVVSTHALCEFVWVLARTYRIKRVDIAAAIRTIVNTPKALTDRPAVEAGLAMLAAGGDFADGVIAHEGAVLGGETFVSFDAKAVGILAAHGRPARLIG